MRASGPVALPAPTVGLASRASAGQELGLVGVWRLSSFCSVGTAGRQFEPFGHEPAGYYIYTPSGHVSIQILRMPPGASAPPELLTDTAFTADELRMFREGYLGYYGTYTITSDSTVTHHITGGNLPSFIGTEQQRVFRISGARRDSLALGLVSVGCRVLLRVG